MFKYVHLSFSKSISNSKLMYNVLHYITISAFSIAAFWYSFYPEKTTAFTHAIECLLRNSCSHFKAFLMCLLIKLSTSWNLLLSLVYEPSRNMTIAVQWDILIWTFEHHLEQQQQKKRDTESKSQRKNKFCLGYHTRTAIMLRIYETCVQLLDFGYFARGTTAVTSFFRVHPVRTVATAVFWNQVKNALIYSSFFQGTENCRFLCLRSRTVFRLCTEKIFQFKSTEEEM